MRTAASACVLYEPGQEQRASRFAEMLAQRRPSLLTRTACLPFSGAEVSEANIAALASELNLEASAVVIGFGVAGFIAAKLQELRPDLHVFCLQSPAIVNGITLNRKLPQRFAFCSGEAHDQHAGEWPLFAETYDARWTYVRHTVAALIAAYIEGADLAAEAARVSAKMAMGSRPRAPLSVVYLLHGKGGSPSGSVSKIEDLLAQHWPGLRFERPLLPHHDPEVLAERSVEFLRNLNIPEAALLIGISLGGLVAAKFQEESRPDLPVICINSPTWADGVRLQQRPRDRVSIYSSHDEVIRGRTADWPELAEAYDFPWLTHDTDPHLKYLVRLIDWFLEGRLAISADRVRDVPLTRQERTENSG